MSSMDASRSPRPEAAYRFRNWARTMYLNDKAAQSN